MDIHKNLASSKAELLSYFRDRAVEFAVEADSRFGDVQFKKKARNLNSQFKSSLLTLRNAIQQSANAAQWTSEERLEVELMVAYTSSVAMIEARHAIWPYEYMAFSRRMGELWEPYGKLPFEYPVRDLEMFIPPLFSTVKRNLTQEIVDFIDQLEIAHFDKAQLINYYQKVWGFVSSGEVKLELDLHFKQDGIRYVVDYKSGFGSNEKGNVNRLLLVASIYQAMEANYQPLLFVRSPENNNYLKVLAESGIWKVFSGKDTYEAIRQYSGYDLRGWIDENIEWEEDLNPSFFSFLRKQDLVKYLNW